MLNNVFEFAQDWRSRVQKGELGNGLEGQSGERRAIHTDLPTR